MLHKLGWLWILLATAVPMSARAAWGPFGNGFCGVCQLAPAQCRCAAVAPPVAQTVLRPQPQIVNVPVTVTQQVTVDQGSYQSVWVPRLVTKNVQQTVLQPRMQMVNVPVRIVQPAMIPMQASCAPGMPVGMVLAPPPVVSTIPYNTGIVTQHAPHVPPQNPAAGGPAVAPPIQAEAPATGNAAAWLKVPSKQAGGPASEIQQQAYEVTQPVELAADPPRTSRRPSALIGHRAQAHLR